MNAYEAKLEARRQRYEELAQNAKAKSDQSWQRSNSITDGIPLGQPILVGHHSEGRHRRDIERSHAAMDLSIAEQRKAKHYEEKANSVGSGGISADDPEAVQKLKQNLAAREANQNAMKQANKAKKGSFETWQLSNNNAQIRRLKERIAELEATAGQETKEQVFGGVTLREDAEENRIMLIFNGKPEQATREILKKNGFRWSPTNTAWQRQLNNPGRYAANSVLQEMGIK
jgi:hypothetical protein